jgi:nitrous oxidase accessory protein NosD
MIDNVIIIENSECVKMMKLLLSVVVLFLLLCPLNLGYSLDPKMHLSNQNVDSRYIPHDSIYIENDDDFTYDNGVVNGTGTFNDPYMISGWEIENITIEGNPSNITKYFEITNCSVTGCIFLGFIEDGRCKNIDNCIITPSFPRGIDAWYVDHMTINSCTFYLNHSNNISRGISIQLTKFATVKDCKFYARQQYNSIALRADYATLIENCSFSNSDVGIYTREKTIVKSCSFDNSSDEGIVIRGNHNLIEECTFENDAMGIEISTPQNNATIRGCSFAHEFEAIVSASMYDVYNYSCDHVIENCTFLDNILSGIDLLQSERIIVRDCIFNNSADIYSSSGAIELRNNDFGQQITRNCKIYNNYFFDNQVAIGIEASRSDKVVDNLFYNNYFQGNTKNANQLYQGELDRQQWNIAKTLGQNIIGGKYLGGNYWDDYNGFDFNGDGLGEISYRVYENEAMDNLPLTNRSPQITYGLFLGAIAKRSNLNSTINFRANHVIILSFPPLAFNVCHSKEQFYISEQHLGYIGDKIIFALCKIYY